jgi:CheY-like chemotaxis protein
MFTILVAEDTPVIREPLARLLQTEGFRTVAAADGSEAMKHLASRDQPIDLVLLDILMPRMHGIAFLESVRADARHATLPVIALTGSEDSAHKKRLRELGVTTIIHKARFTSDRLLEEIRRALPARAAAV